MSGQLSVGGQILPLQATLDYNGLTRRGGESHGCIILNGEIDDEARQPARADLCMRFGAMCPHTLRGRANRAAEFARRGRSPVEGS
jgi:hypothetical protein